MRCRLFLLELAAIARFSLVLASIPVLFHGFASDFIGFGRFGVDWIGCLIWHRFPCFLFDSAWISLFFVVCCIDSISVSSIWHRFRWLLVDLATTSHVFVWFGSDLVGF